MSAHTAEPWAVGGKTGLLNQIAIEPSIGCAYGAGDEVKANARLMAAAPDLLNAVQAFLDYDADTHGDGALSMIAYAEALSLAKAARAKATGSAA